MTEQDQSFEDRVAAVRADIAQPRESVLAALDHLPIASGWHVLDCGCGPGTHLGLFQERVGKDGTVTGLDPSDDNIMVATAIWSDEVTRKAIRPRHGGVPAMPEGLAPNDEGFDLVWSSLVLHHLPGPAASVAALALAVRPGGWVAVLDTDGGLGFPLSPLPPHLEMILRGAAARAFAERRGADPLSTYFAPYAARDLPGYFARFGLEDVRMHVVTDVIQPPLTMSDLESILGWLRTQAQRLAEFIPPRELAEIANYFDPESASYLLNQPGFFWLKSSLLVTGRRP